MQITRQDDTLLIKSGQTTVSLHESVLIGGFEVPGPGEYDVAGISAIVLASTICSAVLSIEMISVLYLDRPYKVDPDDENFANIDVVAIRVSSEEDLKVAQQVVKDLEPRGYVLFGMPAAEIIATQNLTIEPTEKWTASTNSLPEEGIETVVLA